MPNFMATFGEVFGLGFTLEAFSFFVEAIFIAIYVYGWDRPSPWAHFLSGIPVVIAGFMSSLMVITVNAWMNNPSGFMLEGGRVSDVRGRYERIALVVPLTIAALAAPVQIVVGDWAARSVAREQPTKLGRLRGALRVRGRPARPPWRLVRRLRDPPRDPAAASLVAAFLPRPKRARPGARGGARRRAPAGQSRPRRQLVIVPGSEHGTALYSGPGAEEVCDAVDRLLQRVS